MKTRIACIAWLITTTLLLSTPGNAEDSVALGVITSPIDEALKSHLNLNHGLVVRDVAPGSPAAESFVVNDILTKFDDQILINSAQLGALVGAREKGDEVVIDYLRNGKPQTAKVVFDEFSQVTAEESATRIEIFPGVTIDGKSFNPVDFMNLGKQVETTERNVVTTGTSLSTSVSNGEATITINGQEFDLNDLAGGLSEGKPMTGSPGESSVVTTVSSTMWNDNGMVFHVNDHNGRKTIKITVDGEVKHEGPFNTEEDRAAVPKPYLKKFEKFGRRLSSESGESNEDE